MRPTGTAPEAGAQIGRWRLTARLGTGGMATVWRAEPIGGGTDVALKILHQTRVTTEETRRLQREFLTLQRLDHPAIVKVIEAGTHDGFPWLALEYVRGRDLGRVIAAWSADEPADRWARVERITRELCGALAYVHDRGIIHRDLKPGNVLVGDDGQAWLTDFGVVKDVESFHTNLTMAGRLVGTVAFMAPEQITGEPVDARSDLYGLGALMYAMLTGRRPVIADTIAGYLARQLAEMPKSPAELDARTPLRLDRICMRLLQKDPAQRYPTAREVLAALDAEDAPGELPIHGRDEAIARISAHLDALVGGVGGALSVVGPAGSGRSRLLREAATLAATRGLGTSPPGAPGAARVLIVDDLDRLGAAALHALVERMSSALTGDPALLLFSGGDPLGSALHGLTDSVPVEDLELRPLTREEVRTLLRDRGASAGLGAALARRLHADLGGWPGPVIEQLETLLAEGWLERNADGSVRAVRTLDQLRVDPLPLLPRERAEAQARLARLDAPSVRLLEAAAVLAVPATIGVVAAAAGQANPQSTVDGLVRAGLLRVRVDGLQELVEVASPRAGQAVLETIPADHLRQLHGAAARALRERYGRTGGAIAELVAHHLERGGAPDEALPFLVTAAQASLRRGESAHARRLAERALQLGRPAGPDDGPETLRGRRAARTVYGEALRASGRHREAAAAWREALAIGGESDADRVRLRVALALVSADLGDVEVAAAELSASLAALPQGDVLWVEATHAAAELAYAGGDRAAAVARWHALAAFAAETRHAQAGVLADAGLLLVQAAPTAHTLAAWGGLYDRARRQGRPAVLALIAAHAARVALELGERARAATLADELADAGERQEWPAVATLGVAVQAAVLAAGGDDEGAVRAAREALSGAVIDEVRSPLAAAFAIRAWASVADVPDALDWLTRAPFRPCPPFDGEALRQSLIALACARHQPAQAVTAARAAVARPLFSVPGGARVRLDAARVLIEHGHPIEARTALHGLDAALAAGGLAGLQEELAAHPALAPRS
jgi:tetratricopeptide (TPR) repeat protein